MILAAGLCALAGCPEPSSLGPVSGTVKYKGKPLEFGGVTMQPVRGGPIARGVIQPDGSFTMTTDNKPGAPVGVNSVRVTCFTSQKPGAAGSQPSGELSVGTSLIPDRYARFSSSGLTIDVKPDSNETYAIELTDR